MGGERDADITRRSGFNEKLAEFTYLAVGDSGYANLESVIQAPKTVGNRRSRDPVQLYVGRLFHAKRAFIESFNHRLRCWAIMDAWPFRGTELEHARYAAVCALLTAVNVQTAPLQAVVPTKFNHDDYSL